MGRWQSVRSWPNGHGVILNAPPNIVSASVLTSLRSAGSNSPLQSPCFPQPPSHLPFPSSACLASQSKTLVTVLASLRSAGSNSPLQSPCFPQLPSHLQSLSFACIALQSRLAQLCVGPLLRYYNRRRGLVQCVARRNVSKKKSLARFARASHRSMSCGTRSM